MEISAAAASVSKPNPMYPGLSNMYFQVVYNTHDLVHIGDPYDDIVLNLMLQFCLSMDRKYNLKTNIIAPKEILLRHFCAIQNQNKSSVTDESVTYRRLNE